MHITKHGKGYPLVLFHGWGFDGLIFNDLVLSLVNLKFQLYVVDLPGFGLTPLMSFDDFLSALLDKLPNKFAISGWSMGGLWATKLCVEADSRVSHLINIASSPCFIKKNNWSGIELSVLDKFYKQLRISPEKTLEEFILLQTGDRSFIKPKSNLLVENGLKFGLDTLLNWDLRDALTEIKIPVCYVFGRRDAIVPRRVMQHMQINYPDFRYVLLNDAAHVPFLSHQDEIVNLLKEICL